MELVSATYPVMLSLQVLLHHLVSACICILQCMHPLVIPLTERAPYSTTGPGCADDALVATAAVGDVRMYLVSCLKSRLGLQLERATTTTHGLVLLDWYTTPGVCTKGYGTGG